jgi:hypothetical protein
MDLPPLPPEFFAEDGDDLVYDRANDYLTGLFKDRHGDQEDEALRALPTPLADLWILGWLDYEVIQGGLETYFINAHSRQAKQAVEALRRCGAEAEDLAQCLEEARSIVARHAAAWAARNEDLDAKGEYAVVYPFQDLAGVDDLSPVREKFEHLWFERKPHWADLMSDRLVRFRREMAARR